MKYSTKFELAELNKILAKLKSGKRKAKAKSWSAKRPESVVKEYAQR
jgi:hypothetical protein